MDCVCFVLFVLIEVFERREGGKGETDNKEGVSIKRLIKKVSKIGPENSTTKPWS